MSAEALESLVASIEELSLPESAESAREQTLRLYQSYLIPRLVGPERPLTVVFAGPTGAGKSTLLNSIAGERLSETGALRPTTRAPVVFTGEEWSGEWDEIAGVPCEVVVGDAPVLREVTLVDTPDIDSTATDHRQMAEAMVDVADVVVFVSSALRYADGVPWEVLRRARARGAPVITVLNRIRPDASGAVADYRRLLESEGLSGDVVAIGEHHLQTGAFSVPSGSVRDLRKRLVTIIEASRVSAMGTWRRVMASACSQAAELIDMSALLQSERTEFETMIGERVAVEEVKPLAVYPPGQFERAVDASQRSRRRARRALRRDLGSPESVALERLRLTETLVLRHEASLNGARGSTGRIADDRDYETLRLGVDRWMSTELPVDHAMPARDRAIRDLLVRISAVTGEEWPVRLLDALSQRVDTLFAARLGAGLGDEVAPAVYLAREKAMAPVFDGSGEVARARLALGVVIAGYTFSDA